MTLWWLTLAGVRVLTEGETVETVARSLNAGHRVDEIRALNGLAPGQEPPPGTVIDLPTDLPGGDCQPSYVRTLTGTGKLWEPRSGQYLPLTERQALEVESKVCTDADSFATLRLSVDMVTGSYDEVLLLPNSCVWVRGAWGGGSNHTSLVQLTVVSLSVAPSLAGGDVLILTEAGVTVGEGGGFRVAVEEAATRTEAVSREVLTLAQGVQVALPSGYGGRTKVGQAPGPAMLLPPPPEILLRPDDGGVLQRLDFGWSQVSVGVGYNIEFALDARFESVVFRTGTLVAQFPDPTPQSITGEEPVTHLSLPVRRGQQFWWRVTTIDRLDFEGPPSAARALRFPGPMMAPASP
jgi:hypothetical protein